MQAFYWESTHGNFGDDLNLWLWDFLLPGFRDIRPDMLLVGVGTVLNEKLLPAGVRKLVIGSGFGYGNAPDLSNTSEWDVRAVRGPLTAERLGLDPALALLDPAMMVADMPEFQNLPRNGGTIFVPHWESTVGGIWPLVCEPAGIGYVDPCGEAKSVIRSIAQAELVIAESMHAAILADAFRVPWVAVTTSQGINSFKWRDWAASLDLRYAPRQIPISSRAEAITKGARFWGMEFSAREPQAEAPDGSMQTETLLKPRHEAAQSRFRSVAKTALAAPSILALRQARRAVAQLSSDVILADKKQRFHAALASIRRDYF
jgi:succinoglycan biosynthesis protein ExoV